MNRGFSCRAKQEDIMEMQKLKKVSSPVAKNKPLKCCFCKRNEDNELKLGKFHIKSDVAVHYFCLLLSTNLVQRGKDNEGIAGFLLSDIHRELRHCKAITCVYCGEKGASIYCSWQECSNVFHFPCGLQYGTLSQFCFHYKSFCNEHRYYQVAQLQSEIICVICQDYVYPGMDALWGPCCRKKSWYHRQCVQKLAMSSGYLFRCPHCNNKKTFTKEMKCHGIFVPMQDATWEMEENAYQDLLERYSRCDALECYCRQGRSYKVPETRWDILLCSSCGSQGVHLQCSFLGGRNPTWECNDCCSILKRMRETQVGHKYGSKYICKDKDVAMVERMSTSYQEENFSRASMGNILHGGTSRGSSGEPLFRISVHPAMHLPRTPMYETRTRNGNHILNKRYFTDYGHFFVADADKAPQRNPPVNYMDIVRKRHMVEGPEVFHPVTTRREKEKETLHVRIRRTYPVLRKRKLE